MLEKQLCNIKTLIFREILSERSESFSIQKNGTLLWGCALNMGTNYAY